VKSASTGDWRYGPVGRSERPAALDLLSGVVGDTRRDAHRVWREMPRDATAHLHAAWDPSGTMVSAAWLMPRAGRTGLLFVAPVARQRDVAPVGRLVAAISRTATEIGLTVVQALVDPDRGTDQQALQAGGFHTLAQLDYLQRLKPRRVPPVDWPADVTIHAYHDSRRTRFLHALAASYEDTLDCPGLCGMRRPGDILAGHMAVGRFDPRLWSLLEINDQPAGVLLLNPVPEAKCVELVYLGLAVAARGRGLGRLLMQHALRQCAAQPQSTLAVAVDRANTPAAKLYRAHGFYRVASKLAMVRPFIAMHPTQTTGYPQMPPSTGKPGG